MDGDPIRDEADPDARGWRALEDLIAPETGALSPQQSAAARLRESLELFRRGVRMMRMNLRREDPTADEAELDARLREWIGTHPGAPFGDGAGQPAPERLRRVLGEAR